MNGIIKIKGYELGEDEPLPITKIEMWYDRHLRLWTLYPIDEDGNQKEGAIYRVRKNEALIAKFELEEEYGLNKGGQNK